MTDQQFRNLVRQCRAAQKTYFEKWTQSNLIESKRLERLIDKELKEEPVQETNLFQEEGEI